MTIVETGRLKMTQPKRKFKVYLVGKGNGCYTQQYSKGFMGETWATSKAKAVNNIHYRIMQNGEELPLTQYDSMGYGYVEYVLMAEEA